MSPAIKNLISVALKIAARLAKLTPNDIDDLVIEMFQAMLDDPVQMQAALVGFHAAKLGNG